MTGDNRDPDDDNDGVLDDAEIDAGTDPFDASSRKPVDSPNHLAGNLHRSGGVGPHRCVCRYSVHDVDLGGHRRGNRQRRFKRCCEGPSSAKTSKTSPRPTSEP